MGGKLLASSWHGYSHARFLLLLISRICIFRALYLFVVFPEEFEEKCESTGEAGVSGVRVMSGGQLVPWE